MDDLINAMKAKPGQISWGYTGAGNSTHLTAEGVRRAAGTEFRGVPFNGGSDVRTALLGGHIDAACLTGGEAWTYHEAGKLRILASSLPTKSAVLPGISTLRDLGVDFDLILWKGLFVPKGTPDAIKDALCKAIEKAVQDKEFIALMQNIRADVGFIPYKNYEKFLVDQDKFMKDILTELNLIKN